jgi:two-component system OmpR family response regulator
MSSRVLIIDDDPDIARLAYLHLNADGFEVEIANCGADGLAIFKAGVDLVILDLGLPDIDGLEVCQRMRQLSESVPILLLTARGEESDRVLGLELGADDYLTKPVGYRELVARVRAHFRRAAVSANPRPEEEQVIIGQLILQPRRRRAHYAGAELALTAREYDLLLLFAKNSGVVYSRDELLQEVWGSAYDGYEHTVNSHINRLRGKLSGSGATKDLVETVWGVGYRMKEQI